MFKRMIAAWERKAERKAAERALYLLSDRELNDIGISRCDIRRVVNMESMDRGA